MAFYDSGVSYDSGEHYDAVPAPPKPKRMAKVKLELQLKSDADVIALGNLHKTQITGNANFPGPTPAAAVYDPR